MTHALRRHLLTALLLVSGSVVFSQVYLSESPHFAASGRAVTVRAVIDDAPTQAVLNWTSASQTGQTEMVFDAGAGSWTAAIDAAAVTEGELTYTVTAAFADGSEAASADCTLYAAEAFTQLDPQPLELTQTVLVQTPWNGDGTAFGLFKGPEGPPIGPASIAWNAGDLYVLDTANQRVIRVGRDGSAQTVTKVPAKLASDLIIDPTDGSVLVVSQLDDAVYRYQNGKLQNTRRVAMKHAFAYPAKFNYDRRSRQLYARNQNRRDKLALAEERRAAVDRARGQNNRPADAQPQEINSQVVTEIQGQQLLLKTGDSPDIFAINFDQPLAYVDETVVDGNGIVWVLYTQRGDYRVRRLLRIDPAGATAQAAQIDVWFSFDATRRMTATDTGVALVTGDESYGRVVVFDYAGDL